MSERLALDRETVDEFYTQARLAAERHFSPSSDRCQYCDTRPDQEDTGLHLLFDWGDMQPGDISWDGELWLACRHCNWDFERGRPHRVPEGAIVMEGYHHHIPIELFIVQKGEKVP